MRRKALRIGLILLLAAILTAFFAFDLHEYATLETLKDQKDRLQAYYDTHTALLLAGYFLLYVFVTAFSLPAATVLTLLGGAIFGLFFGLILVSFASTIGATLAFLMARFLAKDYIQKTYSKQLTKINEGFEREGAFYLFAMRLVPAFPFFMINVVTALMPINVWTFYWVSQLGMLAGTAVYVYAGTQLAAIETLSDIASPTLLLAFTLLGLFPLLAKKLLTLLRKERAHEQI